MVGTTLKYESFGVWASARICIGVGRVFVAKETNNLLTTKAKLLKLSMVKAILFQRSSWLVWIKRRKISVKQSEPYIDLHCLKLKLSHKC